MSKLEPLEFNIETLFLSPKELCNQLINEIINYEALFGHRGTKKFKLLPQIEDGLKVISESTPTNSYGALIYLSIHRSTGSWINFFPQEIPDDYILFRPYDDDAIYLIASDPTFANHTSKGYVKQGKIYITLAVMRKRTTDLCSHCTFYRYFQYSVKLKSLSKNESHKKPGRSTKYDKYSSCLLISEPRKVIKSYSSSQQNPAPLKLGIFPIYLGNEVFGYKRYPPRWFVQRANSDTTTCWLKRSAFLSRHMGPLDGIPLISRPKAISLSGPFSVIYPCRFGDLVNLLYSPESAYLRHWLKQNPIQLLELIRLILEPVVQLHSHRADISNYTLAKGKKFFRNKSWTPFTESYKENESRNLVHTDIKLDNFLFQPEIIYSFDANSTSTFKFDIELTDFDGLANEGQQMQGNATPGYISPQMENSYIEKECYFVRQLDDAYSTGEMLNRIVKVLISEDNPNYHPLYINILAPLIGKLKEFEPSLRLTVSQAYKFLCHYIEKIKSSNSDNLCELLCSNIFNDHFIPNTPVINPLYHSRSNESYAISPIYKQVSPIWTNSLHHVDCLDDPLNAHEHFSIIKTHDSMESTECTSSISSKTPNLHSSQENATNLTCTSALDLCGEMNESDDLKMFIP